MDRMKPLVARLALSVSLLTGGTAGLAYAGVDLPTTAAESAFGAVGIELPNQADPAIEVKSHTPEETGKSVAEDVRSVLDSTEDRGCEFGQAVAAAASQNSQGQPTPEPSPCADDPGAEPPGSKSRGETKSAEGKDNNPDDPGAEPQGGKTSGETKSNEGKGNNPDDDTP